MYMDAKQSIGAVDVHGSGFRARVARRKGRVRATEADALADLVAMRMQYSQVEARFLCWLLADVDAREATA